MLRKKSKAPKVSEMLRKSASERQSSTMPQTRYTTGQNQHRQCTQDTHESHVDRVKDENELLLVRNVRNESEIKKLREENFDFHLRLENANRGLLNALVALKTTFHDLRPIIEGAAVEKQEESDVSDDDTNDEKARLSSLVSELKNLVKKMQSYSKRMMQSNTCRHVSSGPLPNPPSKSSTSAAVGESVSLLSVEPSAAYTSSSLHVVGSTRHDMGATGSNTRDTENNARDTENNARDTENNVRDTKNNMRDTSSSKSTIDNTANSNVANTVINVTHTNSNVANSHSKMANSHSKMAAVDALHGNQFADDLTMRLNELDLDVSTLRDERKGLRIQLQDATSFLGLLATQVEETTEELDRLKQLNFKARDMLKSEKVVE